MSTTVYIDLETAGLDVERSPIIQVAAIAVRDGEIIAEFERKLQFDMAAADRQALEINSYNAKTWAVRAIAQDAGRSELTAFLKCHAAVDMVSQRTGSPYSVAQLAGHNASRFDGPVLQSWYRRASEFFPASFMVLDTLQLAMWFCRVTGEKPDNMKLATLAQYFGFHCDGVHDALADAKLAYYVAHHIENALSAR